MLWGRVHALGDEAADVLTTASVLGTEFEEDLLIEMVKVPEAQARRAIDRAVAAGVLDRPHLSPPDPAVRPRADRQCALQRDRRLEPGPTTRAGGSRAFQACWRIEPRRGGAAHQAQPRWRVWDPKRSIGRRSPATTRWGTCHRLRRLGTSSTPSRLRSSWDDRPTKGPTCSSDSAKLSMSPATLQLSARSGKPQTWR